MMETELRVAMTVEMVESGLAKSTMQSDDEKRPWTKVRCAADAPEKMRYVQSATMAATPPARTACAWKRLGWPCINGSMEV
jgi:hypothetical protein